MERENYETMTAQEMLAKLKHHECLEDKAKEESQSENIALKASHGSGSSQSKKKKDVYEDSSEE